MKKVLLLLILMFGAVTIFAQDKPADPKWVRIETFMKELSFKLPEGFFAYRNKERNETYLSSYENKVSINISIVKMLQPRTRLNGLENGFDQFDCKYDYYTLGPIAGKIFTCESDKQYTRTIYLADGDKLSKFVVGGDSAGNVNVSLFLMSLRVHGAPMFPKYNYNPDPTDKIIWELDIKNSPLVEQYLKTPDNNNIVISARRQTDPKKPVYDADSPIYSRSLIVLRKYAPAFPIAKRSGPPVSIRIKLRVEFPASGQIESVEVISSTAYEYVKAAVDSLRKLKYIPAQIDGKDVDTTKTLEFSFDTF